MKKHWIEFHPNRQRCPLTYWVHLPVDGQTWMTTKLCEPPLPPVVPGKGYAKYCIEYDDAIVYFASLEELRVFIETISMKTMPTSRQLTEKRGGNSAGPNQHWLSRFPFPKRDWAYRQKAVKYLKVALADFEKETECFR